MKNKIENLEVVKLFNNGKTIKEISEYFNCNQETIRLRLKKEGVDTSKKKCEIKCVHCNGKTRKEGKSNNKQKYLCLECNTIFNEDIIDYKIKKNKLKNDKHSLIKKLYLEDKLSTTKISEIIGITPTAIQKILKKYALIRTISESQKLIKRKSKLPIDEIIKDYKDGLSTTKISNKIGCVRSSVIKILKKNNIDRDNVYEYINKYTNDIEKLYSNGVSMLKISQELDIGYTTINSILHKLNIVRTNDKYGLGCNYDEWLKTLSVYKKYRSDVGKITNKQNIKILINNDKRGLCGVQGAYQLDHKYSILQGFKDGIKPEIIGNIINLEFIPWKENLGKKSKCSISKEYLLTEYNRVK